MRVCVSLISLPLDGVSAPLVKVAVDHNTLLPRSQLTAAAQTDAHHEVRLKKKRTMQGRQYCDTEAVRSLRWRGADSACAMGSNVPQCPCVPLPVPFCCACAAPSPSPVCTSPSPSSPTTPPLSHLSAIPLLCSFWLSLLAARGSVGFPPPPFAAPSPLRLPTAAFSFFFFARLRGIGAAPCLVR